MDEKRKVIKHSAAIHIQNNITLLQRRAWNVSTCAGKLRNAEVLATLASIGLFRNKDGVFPRRLPMSNYEIQIQVQIRKTDDDITTEVHQAGDGDFRTVVSGASGQSIDACEQALLAVNYPALRDALSCHLSEVSQEEASRGRIGREIIRI